MSRTGAVSTKKRSLDTPRTQSGENSCSHTFAPLEGGKIVDGCQIQCPFHRARFDVRTGAVVTWANFPPGIQLLNAVRNEKPLKTYPVTVKDGRVMVEI